VRGWDRDEFIRLVRLGVFVHVACDLCGVARQSVYEYAAGESPEAVEFHARWVEAVQVGRRVRERRKAG